MKSEHEVNKIRLEEFERGVEFGYTQGQKQLAGVREALEELLPEYEQLAKDYLATMGVKRPLVLGEEFGKYHKAKAALSINKGG